MRRDLLSVVYLSLLTAAGLTTGCSMLDTARGIQLLANSDEDRSKNIAIVYRTDADRISLLSNGLLDDVAGPLTDGSECRLSIVYPHPQVGANLALATVDLVPAGAQESMSERDWKIAITTQQLEGIVANLRKANFFERSRPWQTESHLEVQTGDASFGKKFHAVAGLDAMTARVLRQEPSKLASSQPSSQAMAVADLPLRRLPEVR